MENDQRHILVIRSSAMGDVAMTVPVLKALTRVYPDIKITLLTKASFTPFFLQIANVDVKTLQVNGRHKGILGLRRLYKELKASKVDAVADLHNVLRSNILKKFFSIAKIPFEQIDKGREEKKALTSWKNKVFEPLQTTHERYADVFRNLGYEFDLVPEDVLKKQDLDSITHGIVGHNTQKWIGIAPFAQHEGKTYPLERSLQIIEELHKKGTYRVLLFGGGKKETGLLSNIAQKYGNVACIAGQLNMRQELDLISNLDAMVSMDSGNGHMAAMFGVPVVTIWGVTHPYAGFSPFGQAEENNILPDLITYDLIPTSIYGNKFPDGYENAMKSILPEVVIDKIIKLVG